MSTTSPEIAAPARTTSWRGQRLAAVVTLLLLSPIVVNVLFGAIRFSFILAVLPAVTSWGLGALFVRELVRRRGQGWGAILLLGGAVALAEECVFLQTSLTPLIGVDPDHVYGRIFDVNWPYLLWALVYESVWAVALPIFFVEWMYPGCRREPWLGKAGLVIAGVLFVVMGMFRWYGWTQVFIPQNFPRWAHRTQPLTIELAILAIGVLVVAGLRWSPRPGAERPESGTAPPPWLAGLTSLVLGLLWSGLLFLAYGAAFWIPVAIPLVLGVAAVALAVVLLGRWTGRPGWGEIHTLALASGALVASMSAGFGVLAGGGAPPSDFVAKAVMNGVALVWLAWQGIRLAGGRAGVQGSYAPDLVDPGSGR